jgi:hypothetical protein
MTTMKWVGLAEASPEALAEELARREREAVEAKAARERVARADAKRRRDAQGEVSGRLVVLRRELDEAVKLAKAAPRPGPLARSTARVALFGAGGEGFRKLVGLGTGGSPVDGPCAGLFELSTRVGAVLVKLGEVGAAGCDEAAQVDDLECQCWAALYERVRAVAGVV